MNYVDLDAVPDRVRSTLSMAAANAAHLARALKARRYPAIQG